MDTYVQERDDVMSSRAQIRIMGALALSFAISDAIPRAVAGPSAETAKKCIRYSYLVYPYKRPGSVRGSGDRQAYFRECMTKDGNVPEPPLPKDQN